MYSFINTTTCQLDTQHSAEDQRQSWGDNRYRPINAPRSSGDVNASLQLDEISQRVTGSLVRQDQVLVYSNLPPQDAPMNIVARNFLTHELSWSLAGILDGHAGCETAYALARYLQHYIIYELQLATGQPLTSTAADQGLKKAFLGLDDDIMSVATQAVQGARFLNDAISEVGAAYSGSCALVAYFNEESKELKIACTGDSRAVLGRRNEQGEWEAIPLSIDQTGHNEDEIQRLQKEHPNEPDMIKKGRLLGLAVTRAFGDARWKWPREVQEQAKERFFGPDVREGLKSPPYLTAEPVVTTVQIDPDRDPFLIMASDGLWDHLSSQQAVDLVVRWLRTHDVTKPAPRADFDKDTPKYLAPSDLSKKAKPVPGMKYTELPKITEKDYVNVDENVATHLVRNAFGGANEDRLLGLLTAEPPLARELRDDTTVVVQFFGHDPDDFES